ncbi:unnamed protein product, partial [Mesorhabditis spiculigera]
MSGGDDNGLFPFDLATAVGFLQAASANRFLDIGSPNSDGARKRPRSTAASRCLKKSAVLNQPMFSFTVRGPNSLQRPDKSAWFTIGGVYELKCGVTSPIRENYISRTLLTLTSDDPLEWAKIEATFRSGTLLSGNAAPKHIFTMDRPSPRTHRNVQAGRHSIEFTWDASGNIFVYLRFLCALSDLISNPKSPLRLIIQTYFLDSPSVVYTKSILINTVGHPSMLDNVLSLGVAGPIDIPSDFELRFIPEDDPVPLFSDIPNEQPSFDPLMKGVDGNLSNLEKVLQDTLHQPEEQTLMNQGNIVDALSMLTKNSYSTVQTPRPRGRPRKFHYPEYCYSKTALERGPAHAGEFSGPAAEMIAIQQMQKQYEANAAQPALNFIDEKPITVASILAMQSNLEETDKYTISEMRMLSSEEIRIILGNDAEAFRLYHALRKRRPAERISIFIAPKCNEGEEPCYEMLKLSPPCVSELIHCIRHIIPQNIKKICVPGPRGIQVHLGDEMVEAWADNSVYRYTISGDVLLLWPLP